MFEVLGNIWRHRDLIASFAVRDIKARYKQTALGVGLGRSPAALHDARLHRGVLALRQGPERRASLPGLRVQRLDVLDVLLERPERRNRRHGGELPPHPEDLLPAGDSPGRRAHGRRARSPHRVDALRRYARVLQDRGDAGGPLGHPAAVTPDALLARSGQPDLGRPRELPRHRPRSPSADPALDVRDAGRLPDQRRAGVAPALLPAQPHDPHHRRLPARHSARPAARLRGPCRELRSSSSSAAECP